MEKELTCQTLQRYIRRLSKVVLPMSMVERLHKVGAIPLTTYDELKRSKGSFADGPLRALLATVENDPNQLSVFISGLLNSSSDETEALATEMDKDYGEHIH